MRSANRYGSSLGIDRGESVLIEDEDREAILAPIDGSVGIDGRGDEGAATALLSEVRGQRRDRVKLESKLAQGGDVAALEGSWDWPEIGENARDYLVRFGKDLEPMAALIEASAREGPADFAAAMALLADMIETFWDQGLYPSEDEDDGIAARFRPLSGLSGGANDGEGALILPVRRMALFSAGGGTLRHLEKVRADSLMAAAQAGGATKAARTEEAQELYREIEQIARGASRATIAAAEAAITAALAAWRRAVAFVSERTKPRMPAASRLTDELEAIRGWLHGMMARFPAEAVPTSVADEAVAPTSGQPSGDAPAAAAAGFVAGRITRRDDALRAVSLAAEYFGTYEPLSPLGETLREVDRRARLSLYDLLAELIPDESARTTFYWRSGIKPPEATEGEEE